MSKLRRTLEKLRGEFTEMPEQDTLKQKYGFTAKIMQIIERLSPISQPLPNIITQITHTPWAVSLLISVMAIGTINFNWHGNMDNRSPIPKASYITNELIIPVSQFMVVNDSEKSNDLEMPENFYSIG